MNVLALNIPQSRALERWQLVNALRVFDVQSGNLVGHLVNISAEGMMLIGESEFPSHGDYQFTMELPDLLESSPITLSATIAWSKKDSNPLFHKSGFQFRDISTEAHQRISQLIQQLNPEVLNLLEEKG